ncbi:MAG: DMT superfamily drug/metabolite transporter [Idiomarinaceae bacterium HL-53]|nr:MAG: DMT superfamily drug/metabolite transporter [Idiomarinaceae bacterium HL-53]CUS48884.1 EamA-like transporter family protein [Idiomarinaceae bacterium HL-53]
MAIYLGQFAALAAAACWAFATLLYSRSTIALSSMQLNLVKGLVATPLLLVGIIFISQELWRGWTSNTLLIMFISGVVGITLGDSLYFAALRRLGPTRTILLEYLAPPFAALIAWLALSEILTLGQAISSLVVILGVIWVLTERQQLGTVKPPRSGYLFGIGAAICQAVGLVMAFYAFANASVSPLEAAFVRILAGTLILTLFLILSRPKILKDTAKALKNTSLGMLFLAIFMGTFVAIWLQQIAVATVSPGIAQTLLSTAPLFMLGIQMIRGKLPTLRAISGTLLALIGIAALFLT